MSVRRMINKQEKATEYREAGLFEASSQRTGEAVGRAGAFLVAPFEAAAELVKDTSFGVGVQYGFEDQRDTFRLIREAKDLRKKLDREQGVEILTHAGFKNVSKMTDKEMSRALAEVAKPRRWVKAKAPTKVESPKVVRDYQPETTPDGKPIINVAALSVG